MGSTDPKRLAVLFILGVITLLAMSAGGSRRSSMQALKGLACIVAAAACVVLFIGQASSSLRQSIALRQHWDAWPKVAATITGGWVNKGSRSTFRENGTADEYYPEFEYTVGGELHTFSGIQSPFTTRHPYPVGSKIELAYDPGEPESIVAGEEIQQMHDLGVVTTVITVLVAIGLFGLGVVILARARRMAGPEAEPSAR